MTLGKANSQILLGKNPLGKFKYYTFELVPQRAYVIKIQFAMTKVTMKFAMAVFNLSQKSYTFVKAKLNTKIFHFCLFSK